MLKSITKLLSVSGTLATFVLLGGGAEPAAALEIYFGQLTPTLGCTPSLSSSDEGAICATSQTFTSGDMTFTETGS
jgi:hypothetical protein